MKKIFAFFTISIVLLAYIGLITAPYHFYRMATSEGIKSGYLKLAKPTTALMKGAEYKMIRTQEISDKRTSQWENIHFGDFIVPFPLEHPLYLLAPYFIKKNGEYLFGYQVLDSDNREICRVVFEKPFAFTLDIERHRLFQMPLFKNNIMKKDMNEIWSDLFKKDITVSPFLKSIWHNPKENLLIWNVPLKEMSYDLFLLQARQRLLPSNIISLKYWEDKGRGLLHVEDEEAKKGKSKRFTEELLMVKEGKLIYPIVLRTENSNLSAKAFKQRFLRTLKYKKSEKTSSIALYSEYKSLSYKSKLSPAGFNLLFASLSHERDSKSFLKEMIQFLERGRNERVILKPLYKYGFDMFGSSFSTQSENLKETQREKLFRQIENEEQKERQDILTMPAVDLPEQFDSQDEKVRRYLQKAKDKGVDRDKNRDRLVID